MADTRVDVAIIGGGMVGASLAVGLAGTGVSTLLVEGTAPASKTQPSFDDRTTALGNASRRIFESLGVWERLAPEAAAITTIHVSDAGRFGFARLVASEQGIDAFGYVIPNRVIGAALWEKLQDASQPARALQAARALQPARALQAPRASQPAQAQGVLLRVPARPEQVEIGADAVTFRVGEESVSARLVVAADGAHSVVRAVAGIEADVEDYGQIAIVANVAADRPHDGTAYERFTQSGPLAVLPLRDGSYGVVWTCTPARAAQVLSFDNNTYLRELQERFGWRAGRFVRAGVRASYPLKLTRAATTVGARTVLIGNAAQALHPVAGQGFNLGLRDAAMLAEVIVGAFAGVRANVSPISGPGPARSSTGGHSANSAIAMRDTRAAAAGTEIASSGVGGAWGGTEHPVTAVDGSADIDVGSPDLLRQFAAWRETDRRGVVGFTDGLVKMFASTRPGVGALRNLGLLLFDLAPPAKSALARVSAGFGGPTPRLARGLGLI